MPVRSGPAVTLVTPAPPRSRAGNRATAGRWARFLRESGYRVSIREPADAAEHTARAGDLMVALHAWRSAEAIEAFSDRWPERPLIVALTGTDIYRFQSSHRQTTHAAMDRAHALIGLHDDVRFDIPSRFHARLHIVHQSAAPLPAGRPGPSRRHFTVCVIGHLRAEKDPLRAALAARGLPTDSSIRVVHAGRAHSDDQAEAARAEQARNPRFVWQGERPHWQIRRLMARSRAMVMSSVMEGGANVVSEACVAGLPVIASDIPGNRGLLGADYPAYFPARDSQALRALLLRAEREPDFLDTLRARCSERASWFTPAAERAALVRAVEAVRP